MLVNRVDNHEIAEAEVIHYGITEVYRQFLGILIDENATEVFHSTGISYFRRFDNDWQIRVALAEICGETKPGMCILDAFALKRNVADYAEHLLSVLLIQLYRFLVVARKHYFGAPSHTQHLFMLIESLGREEFRLFEQKLIYMRKHRRVETYGVLYQEYGLHAYIGDIVGIEFVLKKLDYCKEQVHVSEPAENIVDIGQILHSQTAGHFLAEWREHDKRHRRIKTLDF